MNTSLSFSWEKIDTVLLDMDGTLLDLHFDNYYWHELLPGYLANKKGISLHESQKHLISLQEEVKGTLDWYCLDYWSNKLKVDILGLKQDVLHKIDFRPNTVEFFEFLKKLKVERKEEGRTPFKVIMATNAHPDAIELKMLKADMNQYFDAICSSHDLGHAKEEQEFWVKLMSKYDLDASTCLFIDDSLSVLKSAQKFGIGHLLAIDKPDSMKPAHDTSPFISLSDFSQLI